VAFSPDGKTLASSCGTSVHPQTGGNAKLWDAATGKERATIAAGPTIIEYLTFSADSQTVATIGWDGNVTIWDVATSKERSKFATHAQGGFAVRFSPDGKTLATAGGNEVKLSETATGRELAVFPHPANVWSVEFSPDGRTLITACWDSTVKLWELASHKQRAVFSISPAARTDAPSSPKTVDSPSAQELDSLWADLSSNDAVRAYRAVWALARIGKASVDLIGSRLPKLEKGDQGVAADSQLINKLIAQLDDNDGHVREKATDELKRLGKAAEPTMRRALEKAPSAEVDFRLKLLLNSLSAEGSRHLPLVRAVEVLEYQATPESRKLLLQLAEDKTSDVLQTEAKASLQRLAARDPKKSSN
jgi:WD domain, G-beta repeat